MECSRHRRSVGLCDRAERSVDSRTGPPGQRSSEHGCALQDLTFQNRVPRDAVTRHSAGLLPAQPSTPQTPKPPCLRLFARTAAHRTSPIPRASSPADQNGRKARVVLESPSNQAIKACVEAGLAISLIDRGAVSDAMRLLDDLLDIAEHEIVFLRSPASKTDEAVSLLAQAMQKHFRV
ncbi:LysR family transcriptional regulator [Pseudomonas coronafaciens pv. oryzae]|nr:LysR family transcriptional regulator [Pseudomonas coronafaciens pv. oryzae]